MEKEIVDLIDEHVYVADCMDEELCGVGQAAHAIAEAMKEGVVWEDVVKFEIDREGDLGGWSVEHGDYVVYMPTAPEDAGILPGKSYRVTMTKVGR